MEHMPTLGPLATVPPTAPPGTYAATPPPPGRCKDDGIYRGPGGFYTPVGTGLCRGENGGQIPFKKQVELTELNVQCTCREACDSEPGCLGFSVGRGAVGDGVACRVYGAELPGLVNRWVDLGSMTDLAYTGRSIVSANADHGIECFKRLPSATGLSAALLDVMADLAPPPPITPPPVLPASSPLAAEAALARCRLAEEGHLATLWRSGCGGGRGGGSGGEEPGRGAHGGRWRLRRPGASEGATLLTQRRGAAAVQERQRTNVAAVPSECRCECPPCDPGAPPQPPLEVSSQSGAAETATHAAEGFLVATPLPLQTHTPAPQIHALPHPQMPPYGEEFLPTLSPA